MLASTVNGRLRVGDITALAVTAAGPRSKHVHGAIENIDFSPDGRLIATAEGTTARVWHLPPP